MVTDLSDLQKPKPLSERTRWERFCHHVIVVFVLYPVAIGMLVRDRWRRWFARFEASEHGVWWYLEDGTRLTTNEFIDFCKARGGEKWYFENRFHWQTIWADGQRVSTIFMGLEGFSMAPHPRWAVLWETMVFGPYGSGSGSGERYTRRFDAAVGHWKWVGIVQFYRLKAALHREPRIQPPLEEEHE